MDIMTAYCGLNCSACPIRLATLETDGPVKQSMRKEILGICNLQYGMNLEIRDITDCDGCRPGGRLFTACLKCEIRKCAAELEAENCAFCSGYPCAKIQKLFETDPGAKTRLEKLKDGNIHEGR